MNSKLRRSLYLSAGILLLPLSFSSSASATTTAGKFSQMPNSFPLVLARTCSNQAGPFATQTTANQRRWQYQAQGFQVSGVFRAYSGLGMGYAFNYFWNC